MCIVIGYIKVGNTVLSSDTCLVGLDRKGNLAGIIGKNLSTDTYVGTGDQSCQLFFDDLVCIVLSDIELELIVHIS